MVRRVGVFEDVYISSFWNLCRWFFIRELVVMKLRFSGRAGRY